MNPIYLNQSVFSITIHNLLDNAIKNTRNGTIKIELNTIKTKCILIVEYNGVWISEKLKAYYMNLQKNYETDKLVLQNYGLGVHMVLEFYVYLKKKWKFTLWKEQVQKLLKFFISQKLCFN